MQPTVAHVNETAIQSNGLIRSFGAVRALDSVSLTVKRGEFFSLLGPSGCGKTTFLRVVAGLDHPDAGSLELAGSDILHVPAHLRPVNTVFQSYALFPHMTVAENVAFGLKMKKMPSRQVAAKTREVLDLVQIADLAARKPHQISGGQKQRVALARAIVNEPAILLLDEPLAALDVKLRRELQQELHSLQRRLGMTFLYVTHDQDEALSLSDRVAVMKSGQVVQVGTPVKVYERPRNAFVAQFVGGCNLIAARSGPGNLADTALGPLQCESSLPEGSFTFAVRPERIEVDAAADATNRFSAQISGVTYTGPETHLHLQCGELMLKVVVLNRAGSARLHVGQQIACAIAPAALLVLEGT